MRLVSTQTAEQFLKYVCAGCVSVAADIFFLYFFTEFFGLWYVFSSGLSFLVGLLIVFILNKYWSFKKYSFTGRQLTRFLILMTGNYFLAMAAIYFLTENLNLIYLASKFVIIIFQTIWNFLFYKFWVFKN